jgi:hypothetical protein
VEVHLIPHINQAYPPNHFYPLRLCCAIPWFLCTPPSSNAPVLLARTKESYRIWIQHTIFDLVVSESFPHYSMATVSFWERSATGERHNYIPGIAITLEVISTLLFALRLLARFTQKGLKAGLDDAFLVAGWVNNFHVLYLMHSN